MLKRIYALIVAILLVSVILTGAVSFSIIDNFNRETNDVKLNSAVELVSYELEQGKTYQEVAGLINKTFATDKERIRITIVDLKGSVLFDSENNAALETNHNDRPEIYTAITTHTVGRSVRKSDTLNINTYYFAKYNKTLQVVIRAALPMNIFIDNVRQMGIRLILILGIAVIALATVGIFALKLVTKPLYHLKDAANSMASGNYTARVHQSHNDKTEIGDLSIAFNKMGRKLESVVGEMEDRNVRMDTILNSMGSPIIAVNENLVVTFCNRSAIEEFTDHDFPENDYYPLISIVRSPDTENLVRMALTEGVQKVDQIRIVTHNGIKLYRVTVSLTPLSGQRGAIVLLQDVTQIDKLQKMRTEFVSNVTHELKTPLTSIRGFVDTLRNGAMNNPEVSKRFLEIIDVEAERLHNLISDILSLSEIEEMKGDTDIHEFDIFSLIDEVIVLLDDEATAKKVSVIVEENMNHGDLQTDGDAKIDDKVDVGDEAETSDDSKAVDDNIEEVRQSLLIRANRSRIKQILINLIENAIRYNVSGGKVFVSATCNEKGELVIHVRDTGNGIAKEHLSRVFERFYRVDKGRSKELGGTGLGLSIVKHIAMLYKGNAVAESVVGEGSVFIVTLKI